MWGGSVFDLVIIFKNENPDFGSPFAVRSDFGSLASSGT